MYTVSAPKDYGANCQRREWSTAGLKYVSDCMVEGIAPREALKSYLTVVMAFNPQAVLDTMNQRLGKTTEQNYATVWSSMN